MVVGRKSVVSKLGRFLAGLCLVAVWSCASVSDRSSLSRDLNRDNDYGRIASEIATRFRHRNVVFANSFSQLRPYRQGGYDVPAKLWAFDYWPAAMGGLDSRWRLAKPQWEGFLSSERAKGKLFNCNSHSDRCTAKMREICMATSARPDRPTMLTAGKVNDLSPLEKFDLLSERLKLAGANPKEKLTIEKTLAPAIRPCSEESFARQYPMYAVRLGDLPWWAGFCDEMPAVNILFPQPPVKSVTEHDIEFAPKDIEALLVYAVSGLPIPAIRVGRSGGLAPADHGDSDGVDSRSKILSGGDALTDINPGILYLLLTNLMGLPVNKNKIPFMIDAQFDAPIWNHLVRAYELNISEKPLTRDEIFFLYSTKGSADAHVADRSDRGYVVEFNIAIEDAGGTKKFRYRGIVEVAGDEVVGGEWVNESVLDHPDVAVLFSPDDPDVFERRGQEHFRMIEELYKKSL